MASIDGARTPLIYFPPQIHRPAVPGSGVTLKKRVLQASVWIIFGSSGRFDGLRFSSGDGSSLAGGGGSAPGVSRRRRAAPRPGIPRKTSQRKYIQVRAEDMFRTDPKVTRVQSSRLVCTHHLRPARCIPAVCFL